MRGRLCKAASSVAESAHLAVDDKDNNILASSLAAALRQGTRRTANSRSCPSTSWRGCWRGQRHSPEGAFFCLFGKESLKRMKSVVSPFTKKVFDGSPFSLPLEEPQAPPQDALALRLAGAVPQALDVATRAGSQALEVAGSRAASTGK